jgi:viroplasmin and RNaseH domain-containing protein
MKKQDNAIVIFDGPNPGVHSNWGEARKHADGYKVHVQGYPTIGEAQRAFAAGLAAYLEAKRQEKERKNKPGRPLW